MRNKDIKKITCVKVFQHMAGGLEYHPQKDNICMITDNSCYKFAPCHMLRGAASSYFTPLSDIISPWIFRVEKNLNIQNIVAVNVIFIII